MLKFPFSETQGLESKLCVTVSTMLLKHRFPVYLKGENSLANPVFGIFSRPTSTLQVIFLSLVIVWLQSSILRDI